MRYNVTVGEGVRIKTEVLSDINKKPRWNFKKVRIIRGSQLQRLLKGDIAWLMGLMRDCGSTHMQRVIAVE